MLFLQLIILSAVAVILQEPCRIAGDKAVERARQRGYTFSVVSADTLGSCQVSGAVFIVSATSTVDAQCRARLFANRLMPDSSEIDSIELATSTTGDVIFAAPDTLVKGGWVAQLTAARNSTAQYRVKVVAINTNKECKKWREAF